MPAPCKAETRVVGVQMQVRWLHQLNTTLGYEGKFHGLLREEVGVEVESGFEICIGVDVPNGMK